MKRSGSFHFSLACSLAVLSILGCSGSPGTGTVSRTTVGDTLYVQTTLPEVAPPSLYQLVQDLVIGTEAGVDDYLLTGISDIAADEEGRIYISNQSDGEVRVYGPDGTILRRFGRRGAGPGEFDSNYWGFFHVQVRGEYLTVEDLPHLRIFDREGGFIRSIDLQRMTTLHPGGGRVFAPAHWLPDQRIIIAPLMESGMDAPTVYTLFVSDEEFASPRLLQPVVEPSGMYREEMRSFSLPYVADFCWTLSGDRVVAWGVGDGFRMTLHDLTEETWIVSELDIRPEPVTSEDINRFKESFLERMKGFGRTPGAFEAMLERATYPSYKPVFDELLGDDKGRIWVLRDDESPREAEEARPYRYEVILPDGTWSGSVISPAQLMSIRGGYAYSRGTAEYPTAVRWRLTDPASY